MAKPIARPSGYIPPKVQRRNSSTPLSSDSLQRGELQHTPYRGVCVVAPSISSKNTSPSRARVRMHVSPEMKADLLYCQILELPNLVRKQLLDKVQLAVMTDSAASDKDRDLVMWSEAVYHRFVSSEQGSVPTSAGPMTFRKLLGGSTAWAPIHEFMHAAKLHTLEVVERQAVYHMLADILVDHVKGVAEYTGAAISPKMVANCTHLLRGAFEHNFPGYLEAGMVKVVVAQMRRK